MKSLLIIDTPCSCVTCPLSFYSNVWNEHQCKGQEYYRTIPDYEWQKKQMCGKDIKPDWCPLIPVPENLYDYLPGMITCPLIPLPVPEEIQGE